MGALLSPVRWVLRLARIIQVAVLLLLLLAAYLGVVFVQVWQASRSDDARPADAIVVLGAAQYDGEPSDVYAARLDHAAALYDRDVAPVIVVTGGKAEGDRFSEATAGADYLHGLGVPDDDILRETSGRNSWESLAASSRFLRDRGMDTVVLVSDPFHAERIDAIADEVGLDGYVSPTRTSPIDGVEEWRRMASETVKVAVGRLIGFRRMMNLRETP
ncbi:MAG: YdcF family protein [Actinobacteria bacterium]|nr:YdcF family protein [Actinomycetota bacterium]